MGQEVQLLLQVIGEPLPLRVGLAVVRWVQAPRIGLEFIRMSARDQERLRVYVNSRVEPAIVEEFSVCH
jgi:hypothetical protein